MNNNHKKWFNYAIEKMEESINDNREDGKICPKVAAVLVFPDDDNEYATRGELRKGNHAEFTLLERKLINKDCSDGILYVTLEPCAPGSRNNPKRSCSEWIVSARIKKVFIGIEDPDPNVAGEGKKYLEDNDIEVLLFDKDSQRKIIESNIEFLEDTKKRKKKEIKKMTTHYLKEFIPINKKLLNLDEIKKYFTRIDYPSDEVYKDLVDLGFATMKKNLFLVLRSCSILFSNNQSIKMPQATIILSHNRADGQVLRDVYQGAIICAVEEVIDWIQKNLPMISDINIQRENKSIIPINVIREALINAIIHRDYSIEGSKIQVEIHPDKLIIKSPGLPIKPITIEQLNNFTAPQFSRNPIIASVFRQMGFCEESRLGMDTFKNYESNYNLPKPVYFYNNPTLDIVFSFDKNKVKTLYNTLNLSEQKTYNEIKKHDWVGSSELNETLQMNAKTIQRHIRKMIENDFVESNNEPTKSKNLKYRIKS